MDLGVAAGRAGLAGAATVALAWGSARAGRRVLPLSARGAGSAWAEAGLAVLAGWMTLSLAWLGLGLAGLFLPPVLGTGAVLAVVAGRGGRRLRLPPHAWLAVVTGAPVLALGPLALLPPTWVDALDYHLGGPEQFLRLHRVVADGLGVASYYQMAAELLNAGAIVAGHDELAAVVSLVPALAGLVVAAAVFARIAGPVVGALGGGFGLSLAVLWTTVLNGKNDPAAAGFGVAGLALVATRRFRLGALVLGGACATKLNGWMIAGPAWIWMESVRVRVRGRRWKPDAAWLLLLAAAPAAWMARNWLARADPFWPILSRRIEGALFDPETAMAYSAVYAAPAGWLATAAAIARHWVTHQPALVAGLAVTALAALRLPGTVRSAAGLGVLAYACVVLTLRSGYERYPLPVLMLLGFVAAAGLAAASRGWPRWAKAFLLAVPALLVWVPVPVVLHEAGLAPRDSIRAVAGLDSGWTARRLTTMYEARDALGRLPGVRSILLVEEIRSHGWPARTWKEEFPGRTGPWALTREAATPARILIRLRQHRITHLAFNFVTEGFPQRFAAPYAWDPRQLRLWDEVVRTRLAIAAGPARVDLTNGGFYLYRIEPRARPPDPFIYYLPGIKSLRMAIRDPYVRRGDAAGAAALALAAMREHPGVGVFAFDAAVFSTRAGDWPAVYRLYAPGTAAGMLGEASLLYFGRAAAKTGRAAEAIATLRRAREVFPDPRTDIEGALAEALIGLAESRSTPPGAALEAAAEAWSLGPRDPSVLSRLARFHLERRRWADAKLVLEAILALPEGSLGSLAFLEQTRVWLNRCVTELANRR
jgi:hypothetical protein